MLGVSRQFLIKLLERDEIPHHHECRDQARAPANNP